METNAAISVHPLTKLARTLFLVLAWVFLAFIIAQVFLAGLGTFVDAGGWGLHQSLARTFALIPVGLVLLSFVGRLPVRLRWLSFGMFLMMIAQFLTAIYAPNIGILAALHPINALVLFWGALTLVRQGFQSRHRA